MQPSQSLEYSDTYAVIAPADAYVLAKWVALRDGTTDRTFATVAQRPSD